MLSEGYPIQPQSILLSDAGSPALRIGQTFTATVHIAAQSTYLMIAGKRLQLPENSFESGQLVRVSVQQDKDGTVRLLMTALSPSRPSPQNLSPTSALNLAPAETVLRETATLLGLTQYLARIESVLPQALPNKNEYLQHWMQVLYGTESPGVQLQQLHTWLQQASLAGVLSPQDQNLIALLGHLLHPFGSDFAALLRRMYQDQRSEARIARHIHSLDATSSMNTPGLQTKEIFESIHFQLAQLKAQKSLLQYLGSLGQRNNFLSVLDQVLQRLEAVRYQNLHGLDHPYAFWEIPLDEQSGFTRCQIHFFGDEKNPNNASKTPAVSIVLDIETEHLGQLWIQLQIHDLTCSCLLQSDKAETRALLKSESKALEDGLRQAGLQVESCEVRAWTGDRMAMLTRLFQRFNTFEIHA